MPEQLGITDRSCSRGPICSCRHDPGDQRDADSHRRADRPDHDKGHEDAIIIARVYAKVAGLPERDLVHVVAAAQARPDRPVRDSRVTSASTRGDVIVALQEAR